MLNNLNLRTAILLAISTFVSTLGDGMFYIATSWTVFHVSKSSFAVGILAAVSLLPVLIVSPISGSFSDRFNKKTIAFIMDIVRLLLIFLLMLVSINTKNGIIYIYIATILLTICDSFFFPCITGIIKQNFDSYKNIFSVNSTLRQLGVIVGSAITGFLLVKYDIKIVLFFDAITFIISAICILFLKYENSRTYNQSYSKLSLIFDFYDGIKYVFANNTLDRVQ